ncbi:MAG TPA: response regulator [Candidatus Solibacter sp.]|nr:response regulator [Candidatus Solibacter sp.]
MKTPAAPTPHILIVDDNRDGLLVRRALLEEVGYQVTSALGGEEGLKVFEAHRFDVVVTDFKMPRMNGIELIQRMRVLNPNVRVVLLSGFVAPLGLTEDNTGADIVMAKSSHEAQQLVRAVKRLVTNRTIRKPVVSQKVRRRNGALAGQTTRPVQRA